jgi:hypothetical protein
MGHLELLSHELLQSITVDKRNDVSPAASLEMPKNPTDDVCCVSDALGLSHHRCSRYYDGDLQK